MRFISIINVVVFIFPNKNRFCFSPQIKFTLSNDGSGRGAALVAAVIASNKQRELEEKKK